MNNLKECAVVIPIYRTKLTEQEKISLQQICNVLKNYDIIAVVPNELLLPQSDAYTCVERFDGSYFASITDYNRLMLSPAFYSRFQRYEYILIYQLDAFVFSDMLSFFCDLGYDYIGAPWLYGIFNYVDAKHCVWHVGNGGLSLRKVSSFIKILEEREPLLNEQIKNEDLFFSSIVSQEFKVAPLEVALQFAFERQVEKCYEKNHCKLPFGCHAWERYNLQFWKPYIESYGYVLSSEFGKSGNEDSKREREYQVYSALSEFMKQEYDNEAIRNKLTNEFGHSLKAFVIFGAGFYGKGIARWFSDIGLSVAGFCDNNKNLRGAMLQGYGVYSVNEIPFAREDVYIVIANYEHEVAMQKQLEERGLKRKQNFITFTDLVELLVGELLDKRENKC